MKLEDLLIPKYEVHMVSDSNEKYIKVKGSAISLLTALSCFIKNLKDNGIKDKDIDEAVNLAKMTDEELNRSLLEKFANLSNKLKKDLF